jgi:predicted AAA+ superfamily ATPase
MHNAWIVIPIYNPCMAYAPRALEGPLRHLAGKYPVVTVTGPRQSGKSTLCRHVFPDKPYINLEALDHREHARDDPRGFLAGIPDGAILDEAQHVPTLFSYLQVEVDERPRPGRFILSGSQHLGLTQAVAQSLAGRTAMLELLPMSSRELRSFGEPRDLTTLLWAGGYPAIYDRGISADRWLTDYVTTYVQRDVRQIQSIQDLDAFTRFVRLCAGRTSAELNLTSLGTDAGVTHNTARAWLSVLEATFICMRLPAWHRNVRKQLVKAPKLHFLDVGLACNLLGIHKPSELEHHPLRGAIFESWVVGEIHKGWVHAGRQPRLWHIRATRGPEADVLVEAGATVYAIECKSGATLASDWLTATAAAATLVTSAGEAARVEPIVVYGGEQSREGTRRGIGWRRLADDAHAEPWLSPEPALG